MLSNARAPRKTLADGDGATPCPVVNRTSSRSGVTSRTMALCLAAGSLTSYRLSHPALNGEPPLWGDREREFSVPALTMASS